MVSRNLKLNIIKALEAWCNNNQLDINVPKQRSCLFVKSKMWWQSPIHSLVNLLKLWTHSNILVQFLTASWISLKIMFLRNVHSESISIEGWAVLVSVCRFVCTLHLSVWFGHLSCECKNKLHRFVSMASKIVGKPQKPLTHLYTERMRRTVRRIVSDSSHPLFNRFELLKSGRRYRAPKNDFKKSFIPNAIRILNSANWPIHRYWLELF